MGYLGRARNVPTSLINVRFCTVSGSLKYKIHIAHFNVRY